MSNQHLIRIFQHNHWANRLILGACSELGPEQLSTKVEGTYGELGRTLAHLAAGEAGYVWRFDQDPDRFTWDEDAPVPSMATLTEVLDTTGKKFVELAASTPDDLVLVYPVDGEDRRWPAWVILGQVIDHGREHRSHAATVLTQLGIEPPEMDMWAYGWAVETGELE